MFGWLLVGLFVYVFVCFWFDLLCCVVLCCVVWLFARFVVLMWFVLYCVVLLCVDLLWYVLFVVMPVGCCVVLFVLSF